jgi:hypothetical protein
MSTIFAQLQVAGQGKQEADKVRILQKGVEAHHPIRQCIAQHRSSLPMLNDFSFRDLVDYIDQRSGYFNQSAAESGYLGNVSDLVKDITAKVKAELTIENTTSSASMVVTDKAAAARPHQRHKNNNSGKRPRQEDGKSLFFCFHHDHKTTHAGTNCNHIRQLLERFTHNMVNATKPVSSRP